MNKTSILAFTFAALGLIPAACTIESTSKDGTGGSDNGGADNSGGAKASGGSGAKGGSTATGGKTGVGGSTSSVAGAKSVAGAANIAGASNTAGSTAVAGGTSVAGSTSAGGTSGVAGGSSIAGNANVAGSTGLVGNAGQGGVAGASTTPAVAGAAGATGATCPTTRTRVDVTTSIAAATTWTAGHVYVIPAGDTIYVRETLTIEPCTIVKLGAGATLYVEAAGQLNAIGTAAGHIVFTALKDDSAGGDTNGDGAASQPTVGDWEKLSLNANSSSLNYVEFRYADAGLELYGTNQSVKNSIFTFNTFAVDATTVANPANTSITGNVFYGNTHPIGIKGGTAIDASNVFHNPAVPTQKNTFQSIDVAPSINNAVTWSNTEVAYSLFDDSASYYVQSPATLTLAAGVVVKVAPGSNLTVSTGATLSGFAGAIFTSYKDDSLLGDSNGDGTTSTPAAGDWDGVRVITSSSDEWLSGTNLLYADTH